MRPQTLIDALRHPNRRKVQAVLEEKLTAAQLKATKKQKRRQKEKEQFEAIETARLYMWGGTTPAAIRVLELSGLLPGRDACLFLVGDIRGHEREIDAMLRRCAKGRDDCAFVLPVPTPEWYLKHTGQLPDQQQEAPMI